MARRLERRNDLVSTRLGHSRLGRLKDPTPNYQIDVGYTEELPKTFRYACFMSYMDIYNEQIYDLLEEPENRRGPRGNEPRPKRLRDHQARGVYADGIESKFLTYHQKITRFFSQRNSITRRCSKHIYEGTSEEAKR